MTIKNATSLINKAGVLKLHSGMSFVFYGIKVENEKFYYYTARGIRDMIVRQNANHKFIREESALIATNHIGAVPCDHIAEIISLNKRIAA